MTDKLLDIPASEILDDDEFNCRNLFTPGSVAALAIDIRDNSLIFPIVVQPMEDAPEEWRNPDFPWRILAGYRRFKAITEVLHWDNVPCLAKYGVSDTLARTINLAENIERKDLTPVEIGRAIRKQFPNLGIKQVAKLLKRDKNWVHRRVRLLDLPGEVLDALESGRLAHQDGLDIVCLKTREEQMEAFHILMAPRVRGKRLKVHGKLIRKTRYRPTSDTRSLITHLLENGPSSGLADHVTESVCKTLLWSMNQLTTNELLDHLDIPHKGNTP